MIVLTVLIALLLMAAGFIFVRYFLPNMGGKSDAALQTTQETQAAATETTELSIPCQELYVISGKTVELNEVGQMFLLHVKASPENTTDKILFTSSDESVLPKCWRMAVLNCQKKIRAKSSTLSII